MGVKSHQHIHNLKEEQRVIKLLTLAVVVLSMGVAEAQSFDQVFGQTQVAATGYYNPAGPDATRNGCSDWLTRSPANGGCYIDTLYHLGQDMLVATPTYTDGTPAGIGHPVYAIADGEITYVSRGISGDSQSATPGYFNQAGYVSTGKANWGTTNCDTIKVVVPQYIDATCGTGVRKYNVAVLVKHKIAGTNSYFWGIYGHILDFNAITKTTFQVGDKLPAGQPFAFVGDWIGTHGRHLHFGVFVPNTNSDFPSIPVSGQKLGLGNDTDYTPATSVNWPQTYGLTDPIQWLTNSANSPSNYITAAGTSGTNPKVGQTSVPGSLSIPQGGVGELPFSLQSILGFSGTAQGNAITTPSSILSVSDGNKVLSANVTIPAKSLVYVPSYTPLGTYPIKVQTTFADNNGNPGVTPTASVTVQAVSPPAPPSGSGPTELYSSSLYSDSSLVSYYRFEGNSNDSKGSNTGTATNITYGTGNGQFGQGAGFNGSAYINAGSSSTFNTGQMSVAFWMQVGSLAADSVPASKWNGAQGSWFFYIDGSGSSGFHDKLRFHVTTDNVWGNMGKVTSTNMLTVGSWYHVVATYDGSTVKMYINGQIQTDSNPPTVTGNIYTSTAPVRIGVWTENNSNPLPNGSKIDDFAIFSRALTATEVSSLYNGTGGSSTPAISAVGTSGGMTAGGKFTVYAAASSVDPANIQALIYGSGCASGCLGTKVDSTTSSYTGTFTAPSQTGTYQFQLRNGSGGSLSNSYNLTINSPLTASCSPSVNPVAVNTPVIFTASTPTGGVPPYSISWDAAAVGTGSQVTASFSNGGYWAGVDLFVTDSVGNQYHTTCGTNVQLGNPSITAIVPLGTPTAGQNFTVGLSGNNFGTNLDVWFCQHPGDTVCYQQPAGITVVNNGIFGTEAGVANVNLSAGSWVAKVRNGSSGTWSNFSSAFTVAAPSGPTELYSSSLFSDSSLVSYYRMEGNSNDSKGSNNGTATGITFGTGNGKFGQGAGFNGSGYINLGNPSSLNLGQMSLAFWLQAGSLTADSVPASRWDGSQNSWFLYIDGSGSSGFHDKLRFHVTTDNVWGNMGRATSNDMLVAGTWYHVVCTYDGASVKMYINGQLQTESISPAVLGNIYSSGSSTKIGTWTTGNVNALPNGSKVDDFAIFSRALTAAEVASLYGGGGSPSTGTVNVTVSGYSGNISCTLNSSNITAPTTLSSQATGNYTLSCTPPSGYSVSSISPSSSQTLSAGGTVTFAVTLTTVPSYTFTTVNGSQTVQAGNQVGYGLNLTPVNNFTYPVTVFVSGLPSNTSIISPSSLTFNIGPTSGASFTLTLQTTGGTPTGAYTLTLHAQGGGIDQYLYPTLIVTAPPPGPLSVSCSMSPNPINLGSGTSQIATATGGSGGYLYSFNGGSYQSSNSGGTFLPPDAGVWSYNVTVKDSSNTTASNNCNVTVNGVAPSNITYTWDTQPTHGVNFSGYVYGNAFTPSSTVWFYGPGCTNGCQQPSAGVTVQSLTTIRVVNVNLAAGTFQVQVRTAYGSATSGNFTVN